MKRINELKNLLGNRYAFRPLLSAREVRKLQKENLPDFEMQTVAILIAGCVKIEITLYRQNGKIQTGYDVFVKDDPESPEWICYDSPDDTVGFKESDMFSVLDRVVQQNDLSYTECRFNKLDGRPVKLKQSKEAASPP